MTRNSTKIYVGISRSCHFSRSCPVVQLLSCPEVLTTLLPSRDFSVTHRLYVHWSSARTFPLLFVRLRHTVSTSPPYSTGPQPTRRPLCHSSSLPRSPRPVHLSSFLKWPSVILVTARTLTEIRPPKHQTVWVTPYLIQTSHFFLHPRPSGGSTPHPFTVTVE